MGVVQFSVIFILLILPWPGWNEIYGSYFRGLGAAAFSSGDGQRIVQFAPYHLEHGFSSLDSSITLGNRALVDSSGKGKVKKSGLDSRSIGWVPTALTVLWGLVLVHAFILFSLQVWIWDDSPEVSLYTLSPLWQRILDEMKYALITQLGASFSVPIMIWILVTFRRENLLEGWNATRGKN